MTTYNDAQCDVHNIQWNSREIGTHCPACKAENKLEKVKTMAKKWANSNKYCVDVVICGREMLKIVESK